MKKITFLTLSLICSFTLFAQSTINITTSGGSWPTEKWVSITTEPNGGGTQVWGQGDGTYGNGQGLINVDIPIDPGTYYVNCYDSYADGWDGTLILVTAYGATIGDNGGVSPDDGTDDDATFGWEDPALELEASFEIIVPEAPACLQPTNLTALVITTDTADLSWTENGTASSYNLEVVAAGDAPSGTATDTEVAIGFTKTGLAPATAYDFYVQAICGGEVSAWSGPFGFTTLCNPIASFPWTEDFEGVTTPNLPSCWDENNNNADADFWKTWGTYGVSGSNAVGLYTDFNFGSNDDYLILPRFTLTGNERLRYSVRARSSSEPNDYKVVLSTTGQEAADFSTDLLSLTEVSNMTHEEQSINLSAHTGDVYIAIHVPSGGLDGYYIYFDNFIVEELPNCIEPSDLVVSNTTTSSADLSWTAGDTETLWNIELVDITADGSATGTATETGVTNPYTISGLSSDNSYEFYVQAVCGGEVSAWSGPMEFYTGHCIPASTSASTYTDSFALTGGVMDTATTNTGYTGTGYADYYDTNAIVSFEEGTFDFSATIVGGTAGYAIWIDWNNDLVFDPATETVFNTTSYASGPFTGTITVPTGTALGDYRLRTMVDWSDNNPSDDACAFAGSRGEVEDYKVTIVEAPTNTADFNNLQFPFEATIPIGATADVYAQVYEPGITDSPGQGAGITAWIGVSATDATTSADFATADWTWITATYNTDNGNNDEYQAAIGAGLSIGTYYYVSRFSVEGGPYTYGGINPGSSDGNFWDGTNFVSGVLSVTAPGCGDQFFDSGGPNGNYAANENSTTTIFPDQMGDVVTVTFTFVDLETAFGAGEQDGCWDFLTIYDGPDTSSPVLAQTLCGEESGDGSTPSVNSSLLSIGDSFTSTHPSGALTFVFISDSSAQEGGWAADITCAPPCLADAGTLTADASPVTLAGGTATISATPNGDSVVPTDYDVTYVLTSGPTLVIEAASATPSFNVTEAGDYTIHTLVAETTDATDPNYLDLSVVEFGVTTGGDVLGIVTGAGLCASLDVAGAPITVLEECTADAGTLTADATPVSLSGGTATISATPNGDSVVPTDYEVTYVLTSGPTLVIEAASATPSFNVTEAGDYTIHTLVAETTDATDPNYLDLSVVEFGVTTGGDVLGIVTGAGLCAALDVTGAPIVVDEELGINDNAFANVSVYPNPVKGNVTLRNSRNILIEAINIYDLSGRTVKRLSVNSNATQLNFDLSELATGMYIMIFNSEFGQFERQIIKE